MTGQFKLECLIKHCCCCCIRFSRSSQILLILLFLLRWMSPIQWTQSTSFFCDCWCILVEMDDSYSVLIVIAAAFAVANFLVLVEFCRCVHVFRYYLVENSFSIEVKFFDFWSKMKKTNIKLTRHVIDSSNNSMHQS